MRQAICRYCNASYIAHRSLYHDPLSTFYISLEVLTVPLLRKIPLKLRIPLVNSALEVFARSKLRVPSDEVLLSGPLLISSFLSETSGIAQGGRLTTSAFRDAGFGPTTHDIGECYSHVLRGDGTFPLDKSGGTWFIHANAQECLIALLAFPEAEWRRRYRIGYWAWETSLASPLWAWAAQFFHEVWVPSQFVAEALYGAFRAAKKEHLCDRIRVMPHPVKGLADVVPDRARFGLEEKAFETLCIMDVRSTAVRKNPWAAIEAWTAAFPIPEPAANLRIKIQNLHEDATAKQRLSAILETRSDISLIERRFDGKDMMTFMSSFDALISLHRSEGFGLTLAEAMAMGVSTVATGWSGNLDFMSEDNSYLVDFNLIPVRDPSGMYGKSFGRVDIHQQWAAPDIARAGEVIRFMMTDKQRHTKAERARRRIDQLNIVWDGENLKKLPFSRFTQETTPIEASPHQSV